MAMSNKINIIHDVLTQEELQYLRGVVESADYNAVPIDPLNPLQGNMLFGPYLDDKAQKILQDAFYNHISEVESLYDLKIDNRYDTYNQIVVHRYPEGLFLREHSDYTGEETSGKVVTSLIYINDDFEGGELYFPNLDYRYKSRAGDLVLFPVDDIHTHGVSIISSGIRYSTPYFYFKAL